MQKFAAEWVTTTQSDSLHYFLHADKS
jgi:hypothetical protein